MVDEKILKNFGFNIKIERMKLKMSQEKLAEHLGLSSVYLSNLESGKHSISLINALKLSSFFNKPIEYFLKDV